VNAARDDDHGDEQFFDTALLKSLLSFATGAIRRHRLVVAVVFGVVVVATILAILFLPRTYYTETKLIAQRNAVMTVRADQNWDALRGVSETVLSHDNIVTMVRQTDLVKNWNARRPPITKLKDAVMRMIRGDLSQEAQAQGLAWMVADRLHMSISEGAIHIEIYWPEPETAAKLVEATQQNFLEARHDAEIQSLVELVSIDEGHGAELLEKVRIAAEQVKAARQQRLSELDAAQAGAAPPTPSSSAAPAIPRRVIVRTRVPDAALADLRSHLEEKRKRLKELEDERRRKRLEAQNRLGELKGKFTEEYPEVRRQQAMVVALSEATQEEKTMSADIDEIEDQIDRHTESTSPGAALGFNGLAAAGGGGQATDPIPPEVRRLLQDTSDDKDPVLGAQLRSVTNEYASLLDQIAKERRELDKAQAAFKYRYRVVLPVETPTKPIKPKISAVVAAGLIAGLALGLLAAIAAEIRSGRIRARWQVERLKLPVLAELGYPQIHRK